MTHEMHAAAAAGAPEPGALRVLRDVPFTHGFARNLPVRPPLSPVGVLAALAGALLSAAAVIALGVSEDPSPWLVAGVGAGLLVVGWLLAVAVEALARPNRSLTLEELVPFATVMTIVGTVTLAVGLVLQVGRDGTPNDSISWWPYALVAGVMMVLWLVPGLQGRPVVLGAGLIAGTIGLANLVALQVGSDRYPFAGNVLGAGIAPAPLLPSYDTDALRAGALVSLGAGIVFLLCGAVLDRLHLPGGARPLIAAGVLTVAVGAEFVVPDHAVLRGLVPLLAVAVVLAVGIAGGRKATTWLGAAAAFPVVIQLSIALLGRDPSAGLVAAVVACFGAVALIVAIGLAAARPPRPSSGPVTPGPSA